MLQLHVGNQKTERVHSHLTRSRVANTRKIIDGKFLLAEVSHPEHKNSVFVIGKIRLKKLCLG